MERKEIQMIFPCPYIQENTRNRKANGKRKVKPNTFLGDLLVGFIIAFMFDAMIILWCMGF